MKVQIWGALGTLIATFDTLRDAHCWMNSKALSGRRSYHLVMVQS